VSLELLILGAQAALTLWGGAEKAKAQEQEAEAKRNYYNALAASEIKQGQENVKQIAQKTGQLDISGKKTVAEQNVMAAAAGYSGTSLDLLEQDTMQNLNIDKAILQQAAYQALQTSQERAGQYRLAGEGAIEAGKIGQELTWLDTAQQIASKWIPKGGGK
jgi:hypothetical protein